MSDVNNLRPRRVQLRSLAILRCVVIFIGIHWMIGVANAKSLSEYQLRLREAITTLDTLSAYDESESESARAARIDQTLTTVRLALPESEQVQLGDSTVTVNNAWLHRELDSYQKSQTDRAGTLARVIERLQALEARVAEFDRDSRAAGNKAEAGNKLKEILQRPEYNKNQGETAFARLWKKLWKWLEQFLPQRKQVAPGSAGWVTQIAQFLVILLALAVIAYVVKTFAPRVLKRRRRPKKVKRGPRIVLGETLAPDESAGDLLAEAEALARRGDLRAAIRKAYIALLVELGDRKVLSLAQHKTNRDYLRALRELEPLHTNVKQLTESFERHWYGFASATDADWTNFRSGYKQALH